ncbi:Uncharacterized protein Fot_35971 [Forsythia ovata]|uniref:Uncharacterized protein n=1 Tax=Forsythia ovata TaxID=205694 RepID=A0ABD1SP70_9LAMI
MEAREATASGGFKKKPAPVNGKKTQHLGFKYWRKEKSAELEAKMEAMESGGRQIYGYGLVSTSISQTGERRYLGKMEEEMWRERVCGVRKIDGQFFTTAINDVAVVYVCKIDDMALPYRQWA